MCLSLFQVSSTPNLGPPQVGRDVLKEHGQFAVTHSTSEKKLAKTNEIEESGRNMVQRELQPLLQFGESASVREETRASLLGSQTSNIVASVVDDPILPIENEIKVLPRLPLMPESDALLPHMSVSELMESEVEVNKTEIGCHHGLEISDKSDYAAADVSKVAGKSNDAETDKEDRETTSYDGFYEENARAELYTFYESEQLEAEQAKASSLASLVNGNVNGNGLSTMMSRSMFKADKLSTEVPLKDKGCASKGSL